MPEPRSLIFNESSPKYPGWVVLAAAVVGMIFSSGPMLYGSIGLFVPYFESSFGWSRSDIMLSLTLNTIATVISAPICGRLIDRFGARKVLLPSILIFVLVWGSFPLFFTGNLFLFYFIVSLLGLVTVGTQSITYIRIISAWFDQKRGLAIGITASGIGLSYMLTPLTIHALLEHILWNQIHMVLAAIVLFVSFPVMFFAIENSPEGAGKETNEQSNSGADCYGVTLREAARTREFWVISLAIMLFSLLLTGLIPHVVPIMLELDVDLKTAAQVASVMGFATFVGRIGVGYLVDRIFAPYAAIAFFGAAALGLLMLSSGSTGSMAFLAAAMIGLGFGAESDLIGYFVSRYFGLKCFGEIYGYIYGAFLMGAGAGPLLLGFGYDFFGGYMKLLYTFGISGALGCSLFLLLRRFPTFEKQ